jgi:hypothetical protein
MSQRQTRSSNNQQPPPPPHPSPPAGISSNARGRGGLTNIRGTGRGRGGRGAGRGGGRVNRPMPVLVVPSNIQRNNADDDEDLEEAVPPLQQLNIPIAPNNVLQQQAKRGRGTIMVPYFLQETELSEQNLRKFVREYKHYSRTEVPAEVVKFENTLDDEMTRQLKSMMQMESMVPPERLTLSSVETLIAKAYKPTREREILTELSKLRMERATRGALIAYNLAFDKVLQECGEHSYPPKTISEYYAQGILPLELKKELKDRRCEDLEISKTFAYAEMKLYEAAAERMAAVATAASGTSPGTSKKTPCFNCHKTGHMRKDCPELKANVSRKNASARNNNPNQRGSNDKIPKRPLETTNSGTNGDAKRYKHDGDDKVVQCFNCGQPGHRSPDCTAESTGLKFAPWKAKGSEGQSRQKKPAETKKASSLPAKPTKPPEL